MLVSNSFPKSQVLGMENAMRMCLIATSHFYLSIVGKSQTGGYNNNPTPNSPTEFGIVESESAYRVIGNGEIEVIIFFIFSMTAV